MKSILFLVLVVQLAAHCVAQDFDFFYFVQQWPGSYCNTKPCCRPRRARPAADFYIHGLWPNCNNGSYPSYCDRNSRFDQSEIKGLVDELRRSWPSLECPSSDGYRFWSHEWEKHGTCSESVLNQHSYFEAALKLKQKADLLRALERKGIRPGRNSYRLERIIESIRERTGFTPRIKCNVDQSSHMQLYQIYLCVDTSASNFIECPIFPNSRCGSGSSLIGFPSFDGWHDFPTQEMELKDLISTLMKK